MSYCVISRGRVRGNSYLLGRPSHLAVARGCLVTIGDRVVIGPGARIVARADLHIGDDVYIGKNVTIVALSTVKIGNRTLIAENVSIHSEDHGPVGRRAEYTSAPVDVGEDAWLGAGVVILKGVTVGARTTVGANATVTRSLPSDATAVGVPARVLGPRSQPKATS